MFWTIMMQFNVTAQKQAGIGVYNYINARSEATIQVLGNIQTNNNWYAELRYNYEDVKTLSVYCGRTFENGKAFQYSLTPMAGFSYGRFTGVSFAFNADAKWKNFFLSSQTQYSMSTAAKKNNIEDFYFSWSELGYNFSNYIFTGLAVQYTLKADHNNFEPGFLAGVSFKNISLPFYVFSPFNSNRYYVLEFCYELNLKKKKQSYL
jgi:hypothetical protein